MSAFLIYLAASMPTALVLARLFRNSRDGAPLTAVAGGARSVVAADSATPAPVDDRLRGASQPDRRQDVVR